MYACTCICVLVRLANIPTPTLTPKHNKKGKRRINWKTGIVSELCPFHIDYGWKGKSGGHHNITVPLGNLLNLAGKVENWEQRTPKLGCWISCVCDKRRCRQSGQILMGNPYGFICIFILACESAGVYEWIKWLVYARSQIKYQNVFLMTL